jgi:hypothetical protein
VTISTYYPNKSNLDDYNDAVEATRLLWVLKTGVAGIRKADCCDAAEVSIAMTFGRFESVTILWS